MGNSGFLDWDSPDWDGLSWDNGWTGPLPVVEQRPWYGNLRLLGTVVGVAAVTLIASTVVLLTLNSPGDFRTTPTVAKLTARAAPSRVSTPPPAPVTRSESATPASVSPVEEAATGVLGAPSRPAATESPAPPAAEHSTAGTVEMPHLPLSRAPMSFTPSPVPRH